MKEEMILKRLKYFIAFIGIVSIFIAGCSNSIVNEEKIIKAEKRIGDDDNKYEDFKEITNNEQVQKVKAILDDINWEKAKVDMVRPPDYRFGFQFKNPKIEAKATSYEL